MKPSIVAAFFVSCPLLFSTQSTAVNVSADGIGEALVIPVFTAAEGNTTLITVRNGGDARQAFPNKALKVRILSGADASIAASFNVYLGSRDSWVANIARVGDHTAVISPDRSCTVPVADDAIVANLDVDFGFVEVIEMGSIGDNEIGELIRQQDCEALASFWSEGEWGDDPEFGLSPPEGGLSAQAAIINPERGTLFGFSATALDAFSDIVQHSPPEDEVPNLGSAHDGGTETIGTTSTICDGSQCYSDVWAQPVDAVAAVLTKDRFYHDFVTEPGINARTEWILTFPLRGMIEQRTLAGSLSILVQDREGESEVRPCIPETPGRFNCSTSYGIGLQGAVQVIEFGNSSHVLGDGKVSDVLGIPFTVDFPDDDRLPESGSARVGIEGQIVSESNRTYFGLPSIGISFQQYTNGALFDGSGAAIRANYGGAFPLAVPATQFE